MDHDRKNGDFISIFDPLGFEGSHLTSFNPLISCVSAPNLLVYFNPFSLHFFSPFSLFLRSFVLDRLYRWVLEQVRLSVISHVRWEFLSGIGSVQYSVSGSPIVVDYGNSEVSTENRVSLNVRFPLFPLAMKVLYYFTSGESLSRFQRDEKVETMEKNSWFKNYYYLRFILYWVKI